MKGSPPLALHALITARRGIVVLATAALAFAVIPAPAAIADPDHPTTASEAEEAWIDASQRAAALNEEVLQAEEAVEASAAALAEADRAVADAAVATGAAEQQQAVAQAEVDGYQVKLDDFANASFRGARTTQFTALLISDSPDEFLDSVTALDRVAGDTNEILDQARAAKAAADAAAAEVQARKAEADAARNSAIAAHTAAVAAEESLNSTRAQLASQVAEYEELYNRLSEEERQAALAAEQARLAALAAAGAPAAGAEAPAAAEGGPAAPAAEPAPAAAAPAPNGAAAAAVQAALSKVGSRYVFGAAGPTQFDCSGLTSWAWKQAGVSIPRTSRGQAGLKAVPLSQLQPGDLITYYSPVSHVAMYIGNGQIVHASSPARPVYVTTIAGGGPNPTGHRVL